MCQWCCLDIPGQHAKSVWIYQVNMPKVFGYTRSTCQRCCLVMPCTTCHRCCLGTHGTTWHIMTQDLPKNTWYNMLVQQSVIKMYELKSFEFLCYFCFVLRKWKYHGTDSVRVMCVFSYVFVCVLQVLFSKVPVVTSLLDRPAEDRVWTGEFEEPTPPLPVHPAVTPLSDQTSGRHRPQGEARPPPQQGLVLRFLNTILPVGIAQEMFLHAFM